MKTNSWKNNEEFATCLDQHSQTGDIRTFESNVVVVVNFSLGNCSCCSFSFAVQAIVVVFVNFSFALQASPSPRNHSMSGHMDFHGQKPCGLDCLQVQVVKQNLPVLSEFKVAF